MNDHTVVTRGYDSLGRAVRDTFQVDGGAVRTVTASFDGAGNRLALGFPSGRTASAVYDELERMVLLSDAGTTVASFAHAGMGRLAAVGFGNGTRQEWSYDGMTPGTNPAGDLGVGQPVSAVLRGVDGVTVLQGESFRWDRGQNKTLTQSVAPGGFDKSRTMGYDSLSRLVNTLGTAAGAGALYTLDAANNRLQVTGGANPGSYSYSAATPEPADAPMNQPTWTPQGGEHSYDRNGNLVESVYWGAMTYDYANRLVGWTSRVNFEYCASYRYDALGRLLWRNAWEGPLTQEITEFSYAGWQLVEERRDPVEWNADTYTYYHGDGLDQVVATRINGWPWAWHAADDQGSAVTLTGTGGTVLERVTYDDYGEPHIHDAAGVETGASAVGNRILYTGQWRDPLSGLYNYRTRWMHPALGRFLTRDTIGLWGDPANLGNGTAYVGNAPWNFVDPWGEASDDPEIQEIERIAGNGAYSKGEIGTTRDTIKGFGGVRSVYTFLLLNLWGPKAVGKAVEATGDVYSAARVAKSAGTATSTTGAGASAEAACASGPNGAAGKSFFEGSRYTSKVLKQMEGGVGEFHSFPESVTAFETAGKVRTVTGGDKVVREVLEIPGSYSGKNGVFQFIKNPDGTINHRQFVPYQP